MKIEEIPWGGLEGTLDPRAVAGAVIADRTGRYPVVDFEPWRLKAFYDASPFEFSADAAAWHPNPALVRMVEAQAPGLTLEVGCGGGRNISCLCQHTEKIVAIDQSIDSVTAVVHRHGIRGARASALSLPFLDETFETVVCDGVAHITGDAHRAIAEVARVLRPGGRFYLAVYRADTVYELLYRWLGALLRASSVSASGGRLSQVADRFAFGGYRLASRVLKRGRTTDKRALRNIYDDYFLTPTLSFHRHDELRDLLLRLGCRPVELKAYRNIWSVVAHKGEHSANLHPNPSSASRAE